LKPTNDSYRVDETYIKVKGKWKYLYLGFKSFQTAKETFAGIEAFHMLRKKQVEIEPASFDVEWINKLFGLAA
jgi:transposase-like protein